MALINYIKNPLRWLYIGLFTFFTIAIIILGYTYVNNRSDRIIKEKYIELSAIAKLKVDQIIAWRNERLDDGNFVSKDPFIISSVKNYMFFGSSITKDTLNSRLKSFKIIKEYTSVSIFDTKLNPVIGDKIVLNQSPDYLKGILKRNEVVLSNITFTESGKNVYIEMYVPLQLNGGKAAGLLIIRINPEITLYPVISTWPTNSQTSELLIASVSNDSIVYLNRLRHLNNEQLPYKVSLKARQLPVVMASMGKRGIVRGIDYRGVEVLADLKEIPGSSWLVVTKVDMDEILSSVYNLYTISFWIINLLVFTSAVTLGLFWRNKRAKYYKKLYNIETKQKELLQQYEFITQNANVIIILLDLEGKIIYANESASKLYGYTIDELKQMKITDLRVEDLTPTLKSIYEKIREEDGYTYESIHKSKKGDILYIEVSTRLMSFGGKEVIICIFHNITENKIAEDLLKKALHEKELLLKEVHHRVKNNLQTVSSLLGLQSAMIEDENVKRIFSDSQTRIKSMSLLHQALYNENSEFINSLKYFNNLTEILMSSYTSDERHITIESSIAESKLFVDHATTLGLIITEIFSNIFKHAFPDNRPGQIKFIYEDAPNSGFNLTISDNGVGFPKDYDAEKNSGLGMRLINLLPKQIGATISIENSTGTTYKINCPGK